jgi:hypothetical protein
VAFVSGLSGTFVQKAVECRDAVCVIKRCSVCNVLSVAECPLNVDKSLKQLGLNKQ